MKKEMQTIVKCMMLVYLLQLAMCRQRKTYLKCGEVLVANEFLESTNGYFAVLQSDCNFVIYASRHFVSRNAIWQSRTSRNNCINPRLVNQRNGNVVIYSDNKAIWSTRTNKPGNRCYEFVMQNDGNLVLYNNNRSVWSSKTNA